MIAAFDRRRRALWSIGACVLFFAAVFLGAWLLGEQAHLTNLESRKLPPNWQHPFGTDWLGRDMLARTLAGIRISLGVGLSAALISSLIALTLGLAAALLGRWTDAVVTWLVDAAMSTPHLVLLILISFACGGGARGVIIAVAVSHWPSLTRIIRAEAQVLLASDYVQISRRLGRSPRWIARRHLLPHVLPQFFVGLILLFPHAILHAAGLTFLGFGMPPHSPAVGVLLAESMRHISLGLWWLAVAPGVVLVLAVKAFDILGGNLRDLVDPKTLRD